MDIVIFNIPESASIKQLESFFTPLLIKHGVVENSFSFRKVKNKSIAFPQIGLKDQAQYFLTVAKNAGWVFPGLSWDKRLKFELSFRQNVARSNPRARELERNLAGQVFDPKLMPDTRPPKHVQEAQRRTKWCFNSISCGTFSYSGLDSVYIPHWQSNSDGILNCGKHGLAISINMARHLPVWTHMVDFPYAWLDCVVADKSSSPCIYVSGTMAPRMYSNESYDPLRSSKSRISSLDAEHANIAGTCFVYRLTFATVDEVKAAQRFLDTLSSGPAVIEHYIAKTSARVSYADSRTKLQQALASEKSLLWTIRFQILKLARNGRMPPDLALALLPVIRELDEDQDDPNVIIEALRSLIAEMELPGPHIPASDFGVRALADKLRQYTADYVHSARYEAAKRHEHVFMAHHVRVTPSGCYFEGPEPEVSNRVVRRYSDYRDVFIRVTFSEEDGGRIEYQRDTKLEKIYHGRFKDFLTSNFNICGKAFAFLGFSGSSLKGHTAWFSAEIYDERNNVMRSGSHIIAELGDFAHFRTPAKCAARIGQAFTDTHGWLTVPAEVQSDKADIINKETNRVFSDGCGTISFDLLEQIWDQFPRFFMRMKPTVLQIRYGGAKGLVSLDPKLQGQAIYIRPSMRKFEARGRSDVEVCGMADRPLPLYLNRPLIKILEDLGVQDQAFLDLQAEMVRGIRKAIETPYEAGKFLIREGIAEITGLPRLLMTLSRLGLSVKTDSFLRQSVDAATMIKIRDVKYRGRIFVDKGFKLFGIMDETGFLKEGQIYATIERQGEGRTILTDEETPGRPVPVAITRSPALHPGDVQVVHAVDVPEDSPLNDLRNVVVFSQHGARDLASMLGGGDLDGDPFDVIFDPRLIPTHTVIAADHPRVKSIELDRQVTLEDMANFFVEFMENDRVGQLASLHLQIADRSPLGVKDPMCIHLAELSSIAVDYQKSGRPVRWEDIPRVPQRNYRPDFMAPSSRMHIGAESIEALLAEQPSADAYSDVLGGVPDTIYYESPKILGQLFRAIDENTFFKRHESVNKSLLVALWTYIEQASAGILWRDYQQEATEIRKAYEENMSNLAHTYAYGAKHPLLEIEVLIGTTFGATNKRHRDISREMREKFERDVAYTKQCIRREIDGRTSSGDVNGGDRGRSEALPRAIACSYFSLRKAGVEIEKGRPALSFPYIAAGVCLMELEKWHGKLMPMAAVNGVK